MARSLPVVKHFTDVFQGAGWESGTLTAKDGAGAVINLTGATVRMHVRDELGVGALYFEPTYAVISAAAGTFKFSLTGLQLSRNSAWSVTRPDGRRGVLLYDIEVEVGGVEYRTHQGEFVIGAEATIEQET